MAIDTLSETLSVIGEIVCQGSPKVFKKLGGGGILDPIFVMFGLKQAELKQGLGNVFNLNVCLGASCMVFL